MRNVLIVLFLFLSQMIFGQEIVELENPSYEAEPKNSAIPNEWHFCSFKQQSPPDIQPGFFGVTKKAFDGHSYASIVTRANGTFEMIQNKLKKPLEKGTCYAWNFQISQSPDYLSYTWTAYDYEKFISPVDIVIYGATTADCKLKEELVRVENVGNLEEWKSYKFVFTAKQAYEYIIVAVQPADDDKPENGHILVDYFTPLIPVDCETKRIENISIPKRSDLLKEINDKEDLTKLKSLINKIDINDLTNKGYLDYQFYASDENKLIYDNIYFNELLKSFSKDSDKEIAMMAKNKFKINQLKNHLESYIEQKKLNAKLLILPKKKRLLKKYVKNSTLLFDGIDVVIFIK